MKNKYSGRGDPFLLITGDCSNPKLLTDKVFLSNILKNLPKIIGMNAIRKPIISKAKNAPGLEGYVPIDVSNITISTYIDNPRFVACIHSCKDFDCNKVLDYFKKKFNSKNIKFLHLHESDFN